MPLPFLLAGAVGATLYRLHKENPEWAAKFGVGSKNFTAFEKAELRFLAFLNFYTAFADCECNSNEERKIDETLRALAKNNPKEKSFIEELKKEKQSVEREIERFGYNFEAIRERFRTIVDHETSGDGSKQKWESYLEVATDLTNSDHIQCKSEQAFLYRLTLALKGLPDQPIFVYSDNPKKGTAVNELDFNSRQARQLCAQPKRDIFYTNHPALLGTDEIKLIELDELARNNFASSLAAEIISAARKAGAKKVTIKTLDKDGSKQNLAGGGNVKTFKFGANAELSGDMLSSKLDEQDVTFEFEGRVESSLLSILGLGNNSTTAKKIIRESTWIKHDSELVQFVESCFAENRAKKVEVSRDNLQYKQISASAQLAIRLKVINELEIGTKGSFSRNEVLQTKTSYMVEF